MKAYLQHGPAHGKVIEHPHLHLYRFPVDTPLALLDCLQQGFNPQDTKPSFGIADYRFTGFAAVNMDGEVKYMIYEYEGMEP